MPSYAGIERLHATGDAIQWGGSRLCEGGNFPTPDGKAHFIPVAPAVADVPEGQLRAQHPARQAVQHDGARAKDPLTGASRDALFIAPSDAERARAP